MILTDRKFLEQQCNETTIEQCRSLDVFPQLRKELKNSERKGIGLSAIQIGYLLSAFVVVAEQKLGGDKFERIYQVINPVIKSAKNPMIWTGEGCLSDPGKYYNTDRYNNIEIEYLDYSLEKKIVLPFEGLMAVVFQHELDHTNGILNYTREHVFPAKIGRNDPCPCNSGKKWKQCCMSRRETELKNYARS